MDGSLNALNKKLSDFKRKYLFHELVKGFLFVGVITIILVLLINITEYFLYLPGGWRKFLFFFSLIFLGLLFFRFLLFPLIQLSGVLNILTKRRISEIIREYIPGIKDRLINILELNQLKDNFYSQELVSASISQKIKELDFWNFNEVLTLDRFRSLLIYFLVSLGIGSVIFLKDSSLITSSGNRIVHYKQEFSKPAPYNFILLNNNLEVEKGKNFRIEVKTEGNNLPGLMYINIGGNNLLMKYGEDNTFRYDLQGISRGFDFYFTDLKFNSSRFTLDVISPPVINSFNVKIVPPAYTGLNSELISNISDLKVISGSRLSWEFECFDTDSLYFVRGGDIIIRGVKNGPGKFSAENLVLSEEGFDLAVFNRKVGEKVVMGFNFQVIPDYFPEIEVIQVVDSLEFTRFYFKGIIDDDYGFTSLNFHLVSGENDSVFSLPVVPYLNHQEFYHTFDFRDFSFMGNSLSYFFSVTDNDLIKGPKTTTSESFVFSFPDKETFQKNVKESYSNVENLMDQSQKLANELRFNIKELQLKNLNRSISEWEKSRLVEEILREKNELEDLLDRIENLNKERSNYRNTFSEQSEEILKKQEQIQELLENIMTDELKKLLEEFNRLAEEFDSKHFNELMKRMDFSFDDLGEQLDRNLEMLKRWEIEQNLETLVNRIEELRDKVEGETSELLSEGDISGFQEKIEEALFELDEVESELKSVLMENSELKRPVNFDSFKEEFDEIRKEFKESVDELNKRNSRKGSESFQRGKEGLENMAFAMRQMLEAGNSLDKGENIRDLRQILKNVIYLSFTQEEIFRNIKGTVSGDPVFRNFAVQQKILSEQSFVIRDSIYAIARRTPEIGNFVNNEVMAMGFNLLRSEELMGEGLYSQSGTHQQLVITSANNLALFLSDILQNMEDEMGGGDCEDGDSQGGGKEGKMGSLKKQSENLRNQLQQMIEEMKSGKGEQLSRQMGQSLMMHEMMQQMLRDLMNQSGLGEDARRQLQMADQLLEQNRRDIMNKRIQPDLVRRHNEIMTRLLEADKSELERDQDTKRESNPAEEKFYSQPARFFQPDENKNITIEQFQRNSLKMNNFYIDKYKNYVLKFNSYVTE